MQSLALASGMTKMTNAWVILSAAFMSCQSLILPFFLWCSIAGNVVGLSIGGVIAMESGMKTVEHRLQGSGSQLLYLMDRYS